MPHNERRSVTEALARYAKQLQLAAPDAMRPRRHLDNVTEMAIATNGHLRPVYASGPMARSRRCALKARRTTWLRLSNLSAQKRFSARSSARVNRTVTFAVAPEPDFREAFAVHLDREGQAHSIVKFLNNLLLLAGVVHFNPVPVRVAEIDLLDPIRPESNGARCALQVFVGDARLC